jgi:hypothetical protein
VGAVQVHDRLRAFAGEQQVAYSRMGSSCRLVRLTGFLLQHQKILERKLPENLKLSIAKKIENNLFLKVYSSSPKLTQGAEAYYHY